MRQPTLFADLRPAKLDAFHEALEHLTSTKETP